MNIDIRNATYLGSNNRQSLIDLKLPVNFTGNLIVFIHGYKGYKDWGAWPLLQDYFTDRGVGFCKFNLSHNGGTATNGIDFPDLTAFSENTYSKEKFDVKCALDWIANELEILPNIHLVGHSRGGGMALLNAADERVSSVITLAGIASVAQRFSNLEQLESWKKEGIRYELNTRTHQEMPILYQQAEDFFKNATNLSIENACKNLQKPLLILHGTNDEAVSITEGASIAMWAKNQLHLIENASHTFNTSQPWNSDELSPELREVCVKIEAFLQEIEHLKLTN